MEPIWALGLMSGTSLDGIDAALLKTDGIRILEVGPGKTVPYSPPFRNRLREVLGCPPLSCNLEQLEQELTDLHAQVVLDFKKEYPIDLVGFHGQTIYHNPPVTWQIGDGHRLSRQTRCDVVFDFRTKDVLLGGQGAPLVPIYHEALAAGLEKPTTLINIGGVSNMTWISPDTLIACDCGPGGALLDDWIFKHTGNFFDHDGLIARRGTPNQSVLQKWLSYPFFEKPYPKSLDRLSFSYIQSDIENFSLEDGAATLTAFTALSIQKACNLMPSPAQEIILTGGGRKNIFLREFLEQTMNKTVISCDNYGWDGDLLEAQAFAFLAVRVKNQLPISFPLTTGVQEPTCGGTLVAKEFKGALSD
jgi:anhydro-N-acetylmuramic acid kinase